MTTTIRSRTYSLTRVSDRRVEISNSRGEFAGWVQVMSNGQPMLVGGPRIWNGPERRQIIAAAQEV